MRYFLCEEAKRVYKTCTHSQRDADGRVDFDGLHGRRIQRTRIGGERRAENRNESQTNAEEQDGRGQWIHFVFVLKKIEWMQTS